MIGDGWRCVDILAGKKKAYSDLARTINCTKDELDQSLMRLTRLRELREEEGKSLLLAICSPPSVQCVA